MQNSQYFGWNHFANNDFCFNESLFDSFSTAVLSAVIIYLLTLPLIAFAVMMLIVYRKNIKTILTYSKLKPVATKDNLEALPISDIGFVIDDSMRQNAIIIDI